MKNLLIHDLPEAKREIAEYQPERDSCHKSASDIRHRIITIRGRQILLDRDLAELYGVSTKALNQAVKRNAKRFPDGYMFQLTREEVASVRSQIVTNTILPSDALRSQIVTSKRGGLRYCPDYIKINDELYGEDNESLGSDPI